MLAKYLSEVYDLFKIAGIFHFIMDAILKRSEGEIKKSTEKPLYETPEKTNFMRVLLWGVAGERWEVISHIIKKPLFTFLMCKLYGE